MTPGTRIVRSCELVDNVWSQVQELCNSLSALTLAALKNDDFQNLRSAGPWIADWDRAPSGWGSTAYAMSFPVAEKRRRKATIDGWINFQVSVFGSGIPPLQSKDADSVGPVIHVSYWHVQTTFRESGKFLEFPWAMDDNLQVKNERLLLWDSQQDGVLPEWTFTTRLLELATEDALSTAILQPLKCLLSNIESGVMLLNTLSGNVSYTQDVDKELGPVLVASA